MRTVDSPARLTGRNKVSRHSPGNRDAIPLGAPNSLPRSGLRHRRSHPMRPAVAGETQIPAAWGAALLNGVRHLDPKIELRRTVDARASEAAVLGRYKIVSREGGPDD
jgi:hypothetical protein